MKEVTPAIRGAVHAYLRDHPKATDEALAKRFKLTLAKVREARHG